MTTTAKTPALDRLLDAPGDPDLLLKWADCADLDAALRAFAGSVLRRVWESPDVVLQAVDRVHDAHRAEFSLHQQGVLLRLRAHAQRGVGHVRRSVRNYQEATGIFLRCEDPEEAGKTAVGHLYSLALLGRSQTALTVAREARNHITNDRTRARLELNLAHVFLHSRQLAEANHRYRTALARFEATEDVGGMGACWHHLAIVANHQGDADLAAELFPKAKACFEQVNMGLPSMYCDAGLALAELTRGNWEDALAQLQRLSERFVEVGDRRAEGLVQREIASGFLALGALDSAREEALKAVDKMRDLGLGEDAARLDLVLGRLYAMGGWFQEAHHYLERSRNFYAEQGNRWLFHRGGVDLARILLATRRPSEALKVLRSARRYLDRVDPNGQSAIAAGVQAEAHLALGKPRVSLRLAKAARQRATDYPASLHRPHLSLLVARCYAALGQSSRVVRWAQSAIEELEVALCRFGSRQLRETLSESREPIYGAAVRLIEEHSADPSPGQVLELLCRSRASVLVEECLHGSEGAMQRGTRAAISRLRDDLLQDPHGMDIRLQQATVQQEISRLSRRLDRRLRGADRVAKACAIEAWAPRLQGRTLVMFDHHDDDWRAFVVHADQSVAVVELPELCDALRDDWRPLALTFQTAASVDADRRAEFLDRTLEDSQERFARLGDAIWGSIRSDASSVVIVPDGELHDLPLEALAEDRFAAVSRLPHPSLLRSSSDAATPVGSALVLHGPSTAMQDEAASVAETLSNTGLQVEVSSKRDSLDETERRVLHVASHGTLHPDGWLLSGLELGDGWMGFEALTRPSLRGTLLYLSSCESGVTHRTSGSNLRGWLAAGLGAGAKEMMLTLWKLDDATAAGYADAFYSEWTSSGQTAAAARSARATVRAASPHPFAWAPFVAVG